MRRLAGIAFILLLAASAFAQRHGGEPGIGRTILGYLFGYGFILQILAIVYLVRRGGDRFWIWIIILGGVVGALAYFLIEALPAFDDMRRSLRGPARRKRIAQLRALVRDNPSAGNYEELGDLLAEEKKWREAREAFDRALASRTDSLHPFYWRGVAAFELGDEPAAIEDFRHVVKVDPKYDYSRAQCLLARALARMGDTSEAIAIFENLAQSTTSAQSLSFAAEFFIERGRYAEAAHLVDSILARRDTMPSYQKRRDRPWLHKAKRLQRKLKAAAVPPHS